MTRRSLIATAQGVTTIGLLFLLFRGFDWMAFRGLYARLPALFYAASLLVVVAGILLYAWRWQLLLATGGIRLPYRGVLQQYVIGVFANNFLPSTFGGDVVKVFYLGRDHGFRAVGASVLVDRFLGLGLMAMLAAAALWIEPITDARLLTARVVLSGVAGAFAATVAAAVIGTGGLPQRVRRFGDRVVALATQLQRVRLDLSRAITSFRVWVQSAATVVLYFVLVTLVYREFILMQTGLSPAFFTVLMVVASTAVLSSIPVSINGIGLREQLHVLLLEPLGVPREVAVAISLLLFAHLLLVSLVGGVLWWHAMGGAGGRGTPRS